MRIRVEDNAYDCLIDTGSEVNLMPSKYVKGMNLQPSSRLLQAANGTTIGVLGETDIQVEISRRRIPTRFIVSDQVDEILIGVEWLQENNCQIVFPKNSIVIDGEVVPLLKKAMGLRCNRIILQEEVCVPASSEMNVMGKMVYANLPTTNRGTWATSPAECKPVVHTACSLIPNRSMNIPVRILNVKQQPQTIEKGAYLTTVQEDTLLNSETSPEVISEDRRAKINVHIDNIIGQVDPDVDDDHKLKLRQLLEEYQDIISSDEIDLGKTDLVEHRIDTGDAKPVRQSLRRMPAAYSHIIDEQIELMLKQGIIEPAVSEWSSNVVLVKKKDQSYRFCIDFRQLNEISVKDTQPIPRIDSCLEALAGSSWFTTSTCEVVFSK